MGSAFHQQCPRYSGTLTPTAPTANRLWETLHLLPAPTQIYVNVARRSLLTARLILLSLCSDKPPISEKNLKTHIFYFKYTETLLSMSYNGLLRDFLSISHTIKYAYLR